MPIINLPIERIGLVAKGELQPYVDDRHVNATAAAAIITTLEKQRLRDADFFVDGRWSFACRREGPFPNIAECFPEDVAAELGSKMAQRNAADMPVSQWCSVLRNALAHGGVAYLNAQGQSYPQGRVKMYAFVSGKHDKDSRERPKPLTVVNYLRISEDGYRDFLQRWVDWL